MEIRRIKLNTAPLKHIGVKLDSATGLTGIALGAHSLKNGACPEGSLLLDSQQLDLPELQKFHPC